MGRAYKLSDGTLGPFPEGRNVAARASSRVYTDLNRCKKCGSLTFITASGRCVTCMRNQITAVYMYNAIPEGSESYNPALNLPEDFEAMDEAKDAVKLLKSGQGFKLGREVCSTHGHIKLTNDKYHKCYFCETQRNKRQQAIDEGDAYYLTRSQCSGCHNVTLRHTRDSSCVDCGYVPKTRKGATSGTTEMMKASPDTIISREEARSLDMKVYRTGEPCSRGHKDWRYVSTGNCVTCLKGKK